MKQLKRMQNEFFRLSRLDDDKISIEKKSDDMKEFVVYLKPDYPYDGKTIILDLQVKDDYPFSPPFLKFRKRMYHPNIEQDGTICLDIMKKDTWKPAFKIQDVLYKVLELLSNPNRSSPVNMEDDKYWDDMDEIKDIVNKEL